MQDRSVIISTRRGRDRSSSFSFSVTFSSCSQTLFLLTSQPLRPPPGRNGHVLKALLLLHLLCSDLRPLLLRLDLALLTDECPVLVELLPLRQSHVCGDPVDLSAFPDKQKFAVSCQDLASLPLVAGVVGVVGGGVVGDDV